MHTNRTNCWLSALIVSAALIAWAGLTSTAEARTNSKGQNVMQLKVGEVQYMPATGWTQVDVSPPGLVHAILDRRKGQLTLIPKARGTAVLEFKMEVPKLPKPVKGKIKLKVF